MQTSPLRSGAVLPTHPDHTTSLKIVNYGRVRDAEDGHELASGLHRAEVSMLKHGDMAGMAHLYRYQRQEGRIFHTRDKVVIEVECINDNAAIQ